MSRDHASGRIGIALGRIRCLNTGTVSAPINIPHLHSSLLVDCHVKEVEQIAANISATMHPYATALQWIFRSGVGSRPVESSVERTGNVEMPDAVETVCRLISGSGRAVKGHCGAASIGCYRGRESDVLQTVNHANVINILPCLSAVCGCRHNRVGPASGAAGDRAGGHCKIDSTIVIDSDCRVLKIRVSTRLGGCVLDGPYVPSQAVIF